MTVSPTATPAQATVAGEYLRVARDTGEEERAMNVSFAVSFASPVTWFMFVLAAIHRVRAWIS